MFVELKNVGVKYSQGLLKILVASEGVTENLEPPQRRGNPGIPFDDLLKGFYILRGNP